MTQQQQKTFDFDIAVDSMFSGCANVSFAVSLIFAGGAHMPSAVDSIFAGGANVSFALIFIGGAKSTSFDDDAERIVDDKDVDGQEEQQ